MSVREQCAIICCESIIDRVVGIERVRGIKSIYYFLLRTESSLKKLDWILIRDFFLKSYCFPFVPTCRTQHL